MPTVYFVVELQTNDPSGAIVTVFTDLALAKQKYYQVMAAAAVSSVLKHGAMLVTSDMFVIMSGVEVHEPIIEEPAE